MYSLLNYHVLLSSADYNEHEYIVHLNYGTDAELQLLMCFKCFSLHYKWTFEQ